MEFLRVEALTKHFGGVLALDRVDLEIQGGEIHSIVGENGAGKSTLLKILAGIVGSDEGEVFFCGERITDAKPNQLFELGISVAFQETSLFDNLTIAENLFIGGLYNYRRFGINWRTAAGRAGKILEDFGLGDIDPQSRTAGLSTEMKQIIEILKSVKENARLICLDEPTAPLTRGGTQLLFSLLEELKNRGITVVYVSHNLEEVLRISDRITVLRDGRKVKTIGRAEASEAVLHDLMIGRSILRERRPRRGEIDRKAPILRVEGLTDGDRVRDVSFSVHRGEILGLTGLVGAGRSDVAWMLFGLTGLSGGEIYVEERLVEHLTPDQAIREGIYYLPEDRRLMGLFLNQNLVINTTIAKLDRVKRRFTLDFKLERSLTAETMGKLGVKYSSLNQSALNLSGGNQQKLLFGKCLFAEPKIFLLDEPTKGIDVGSKEEIYELIRALAAQGMAVVLISSEVEEICLLSDRVIVMGDGTIIGTFEGERINEREITTCYLQSAKSG
jgi:ABC-type sugar transport system ATPase subunit